MAVCPSDTQSGISSVITDINLWPAVSPGLGWAQWDSHCGEVAPASWQQPPFPSLIPLLPAGPEIRKIMLWYGHRWHGKTNSRKKRETDSVYSCECVCTLHEVTAGRQQTMEIRGHHKIYLAFLPFSAILLSLIPANHEFLSQNSTADTHVVKHGCWITENSNYWNILKRDVKKDTMMVFC